MIVWETGSPPQNKLLLLKVSKTAGYQDAYHGYAIGYAQDSEDVNDWHIYGPLIPYTLHSKDIEAWALIT